MLTEFTAGLITATIPSPSQGVWYLGPVPIRGYALCIILGIVAAIWIGERRWQARGGRYGDIQDIAIWAVPFGLVGGRLYHVATDWEKYFGEGKDPISALYVWRGGLGIWGAIALGALGAYLGARSKGIRFLPLVDVLAPGVLVAQAIGRWGNWFNQELYGRPTDLPWGLEIDPSNWPRNCDYPAGSGTCTFEVGTTFHPTFLYESLWNLAAFGVVLWLERRYRLGYGRVMAVYVMAYTLGRGWIEYLRIDDVQLEHVLGLRFNVWTSIVLFVAAALFFEWSRRTHPGREDSVYLPGREPSAEAEEDEQPQESRGGRQAPDEGRGGGPATGETGTTPGRESTSE
ncbi:prolipoprotein diacylglyceryl transferase [Nocardioides sp. GY 10113]|uniref:prolipoprotein diacylglyceryl transferase n=1 Tax=Nocardioides sp. GY 10113 TaxID=2569761 RepID=UPI0010A789A7|nr:prolipoprotein diacylglyceryl transferase [Nocardioides sp. GY 10113]TIC88598.1 prolipoprotein diacylglyceryl transferase [Nocardioides sp. GY 10113]